jgi:ADP-ribose pyrophosphatase
MAERKLDSRRLYDGHVVALEVDRVRLADGNESRREVVRHAGAAVLLPITEDGRILFVRQFRYATGEELLELPAGTLETGESPRDCAARELQEETGRRAHRLDDLGSFFSTPGFSDELLHAFVATGLEPATAARPDPDESIAVDSLGFGEALAAVRDGGIRDAKTIATLFLARLHGLI